MFEAVAVPEWVLLIYEGQRRFNPRAADNMIEGFVKACRAVGRAFT
jgi:hypothetical protein